PLLFLNRLFSSDTALRILWLRDTDDVAALVTKELLPGEALGVDKLLPARFLLPLQEKGVSTRLGSPCVDWTRAVKDARECALMAASSAANDRVMERVTAFLREGVTEREVEAELYRLYAEEGCEGVSFAPIVSFGPHAADPHHAPDDTPLRRGDAVILDIGGKKDGYASDMTRTWFCGEPAPEYAALHDLAVLANETAERMIRPGVRLCEIDAAARNVIARAGYGDFFTHRLGHFIGREVHEYGDVSAAFTEKVEPGMHFSIEPGIYLPGRFGVRIEDLVCVTEDGCRVLNAVPKKWRAL
ncbi:MAG: M24 family metallopeptidase, partial [bacterium]